MTRRILTGKVIKDKSDKTVVVEVKRKYSHPLFKKVITTSKKYLAHDADNVITQYVKGKIFIETGTCLGRSVKHALVRGAKEVRSVEGAQKYYSICESEFAHDPRVKLWYGNSVDKLSEMIKSLHKNLIVNIIHKNENYKEFT